MGESGEKLFAEAQDAMENALRFIGYRRRLEPIEFQELRSFVMFKLIDNDYARLRKYECHGSMAAYLSVVVHRLYLDFQTSRWGRWYPSAEAQRRGPTAVELERLIYRDGYEIREAVEHLAMRGGLEGSREDLLRLAYALPVRHPTRMVAQEQLHTVSSSEPVDCLERRERDALRRKLEAELHRAMASLDGDDWLVLKMRYRDSRSVAQIASTLGLEAKPLYARIRRVLGRVREGLERSGIGREQAVELVRSSAREIDLDAVFTGSAA